jgi:hypothetical protein
MSGAGKKRKGNISAALMDADGAAADDDAIEDGLDVLLKRTKTFRPSPFSQEYLRYMGDPQDANKIETITDGGAELIFVSDAEAREFNLLSADQHALLVRDVVRAIVLRTHTGLSEFERSAVNSIIKSRAAKCKSA